MNKHSRLLKALLYLGSFGMLGLGIGLGMSNWIRAVPPVPETETELEPGQAAAKPGAPQNAAPGGMNIPAGPVDINELSMEVAALRTLYLLNVWPDHYDGSWTYHTNAPWVYILDEAQTLKTAEAPRKRKDPVAPDATTLAAYKKVLNELRIAYIAGQDDRIVDLTDQLDELNGDDSIELDDAVTITENAKKICHKTATHPTPENIVSYLNSYGKSLPSPHNMIGKVFIERNAGQKISEDSKKYLLKELSYLLCGYPHFSTDKKKEEELLNKDKQRKEEINKRMSLIIDKASDMTPEQCKKEWALNGSLRNEYDKMKREILGAENPDYFDVLRHLIQQDMAELLSNQRLVEAMDARVSYLKKAGIIQVNKN
jgi:hypothetical protein